MIQKGLKYDLFLEVHFLPKMAKNDPFLVFFIDFKFSKTWKNVFFVKFKGNGFTSLVVKKTRFLICQKFGAFHFLKKSEKNWKISGFFGFLLKLGSHLYESLEPCFLEKLVKIGQKRVIWVLSEGPKWPFLIKKWSEEACQNLYVFGKSDFFDRFSSFLTRFFHLC